MELHLDRFGINIVDRYDEECCDEFGVNFYLLN